MILFLHLPKWHVLYDIYSKFSYFILLCECTVCINRKFGLIFVNDHECAKYIYMQNTQLLKNLMQLMLSGVLINGHCIVIIVQYTMSYCNVLTTVCCPHITNVYMWIDICCL